MTRLLVFASAVGSTAPDSDRSHLRRWVASSDQRRGGSAEALHKSEPRLIVDGDASTTSSSGQQCCRPDVHPRIERHGS